MKNNFFSGVHDFIRIRIKKNIRLQLMGVFAACVFLSIITMAMTNFFFSIKNNSLNLKNHELMMRTNNIPYKISNYIQANKIRIDDTSQIQNLFKEMNLGDNNQVIISDSVGKVLYSSNNTSKTQVNIDSLIKKYFDATRDTEFMDRNMENTNIRTGIYPVKFSNGYGYILMYPTLNEKLVSNVNSIDSRLLSIVTAFSAFILLFFLLTNKKMKYIESVSSGLLEISKGNLDYRIKRQGHDELALLADNINYMATELKTQIESERKAEKTKNELISNVSHDLRTPLTSIKGYLGLIKEDKYTDKKQVEQYVNIAYNKAEKLENLVDDLFEYTKLINNAVVLEKQEIVLNELLEQLIEEFVPVCEANDVNMKKDFIKEKIIVYLDPSKTMRVFENLLVNAVRYSLKPSDILISIKKEENEIIASVTNKCNPIDKKDLEKIFDRFYRVEKSRSSNTGGSGLGLAIAKNMMELQGGSIEVTSEDDNISFIVKFNPMDIRNSI